MPGSGPANYSEVAVPLDGSVQRGNAGYLAPGQTKIAININGVSTTSNVTIPLPTPPTGKSWLLTDFAMTHDQASGQQMALTVGGITIWSTQVHGSLAPDLFPGMETQLDFPQGLAAALVVTGASNMHTWANFAGIQQNVGSG